MGYAHSQCGNEKFRQLKFEIIEFIKYLFSLFVYGMLFNDAMRVRPELRALLRFGSYHRLPMDEQVLFANETLRECMLCSMKDSHHGLAPFDFYMQQFAKYLDGQQQIETPMITCSDDNIG